jgi:ethanolamine utilization microcompartment shell protein EutS
MIMKKNLPFLKRITNLVKPSLILALILLTSSTSAVFAQDWNQVIKAVASDRGALDKFAYSVDISGDYAIFGALQEDEDSIGLNTISEAGSAYIFKNIAGTWTEVQKIVASDRGEYDYFGISVAISGRLCDRGGFSG